MKVIYANFFNVSVGDGLARIKVQDKAENTEEVLLLMALSDLRALRDVITKTEAQYVAQVQQMGTKQ